VSQEIYNVVSILAIFSLAIAVFQLKHEVDIFRIQMAKIITSMGILIKTTADGTSLEVNDKVKIIQYADDEDGEDDEE
jgi:hypothetical protein